MPPATLPPMTAGDTPVVFVDEAMFVDVDALVVPVVLTIVVEVAVVEVDTTSPGSSCVYLFERRKSRLDAAGYDRWGPLTHISHCNSMYPATVAFSGLLSGPRVPVNV